ncbi:MAG: hypothetical protein RR569_03455 [Acinetobacter sp.]
MNLDISKNIKAKNCSVTSYLVSYYLEGDADCRKINIPNNYAYVLDNRNLNIISKDAIEKLTGFKPKKILRTKLMFGVCQLCDGHKELKRSHVIGASVFSKILKLSSINAAVLVSMNKNELKLSNDNWTSYMLCNECESHFNSNYEDYSIHALRNEIDGLSSLKTEHGIIFNGIDTNKIILYVLSIYWRASLSVASAYNKVLITNGIYENLKNVFLGKFNFDSNVFKIRICKLIDEAQAVNEFKLQYFIIFPFVRLIGKGLVYSFVFEGYLFQIFINCTNMLEKEGIRGLIDNQASTILIPYIDFCNISEIKEILQQGVVLVEQDQKILSLCLKESENLDSSSMA